MASRKNFMEVISGMASEMIGVSLLVSASESRETLESRTSSSMRKAAAWMALTVACGTLGWAAAVRRMRTILDRS